MHKQALSVHTFTKISTKPDIISTFRRNYYGIHYFAFLHNEYSSTNILLITVRWMKINRRQYYLLLLLPFNCHQFLFGSPPFTSSGKESLGLVE